MVNPDVWLGVYSFTGTVTKLGKVPGCRGFEIPRTFFFATGSGVCRSLAPVLQRALLEVRMACNMFLADIKQYITNARAIAHDS